MFFAGYVSHGGSCGTHDEWQPRNIGEEETGSGGGNIGNEDLD
jgi:hypothetical protein